MRGYGGGCEINFLTVRKGGSKREACNILTGAALIRGEKVMAMPLGRLRATRSERERLGKREARRKTYHVGTHAEGKVIVFTGVGERGGGIKGVQREKVQKYNHLKTD